MYIVTINGVPVQCQTEADAIRLATAITASRSEDHWSWMSESLLARVQSWATAEGRSVNTYILNAIHASLRESDNRATESEIEAEIARKIAAKEPLTGTLKAYFDQCQSCNV